MSCVCGVLELTGGIGADVDDLAFGSVNLVLVRCGQLSFDHNGVLGPGLQWSDQVPRILCLLAVRGTGRRVDVSDRPAIGATCVLSIELRHILVWPGETNGSTGANELGEARQLLFI